MWTRTVELKAVSSFQNELILVDDQLDCSFQRYPGYIQRLPELLAGAVGPTLGAFCVDNDLPPVNKYNP